MSLGADPEAVGRAVAHGDPLPGGRGFAGKLPDGRLVRDVLGRRPLFFDPDTGAHRPDPADGFRRFPAGHVRDPDGEVRRVWSLPDPDPAADPEAAVDRVEAAVAASLSDVTDAADGDADAGLAVAFSGGVDSALVAAGLDAPLYVVGFEGGRDLAGAREAAAEMGRPLHEVVLDADTLERAVPEVARAIDRTNAMDVAIALPLYLVARRAAADGYDRLALGQGADELFGGYAKVANAPDDHRVEADTVRGARREVVETLPDQLERDWLALRAAGVEPVTPLLDDRVVRAALALPGDLLVDDAGVRKKALRLAARSWLPESVASREKVAVQYGSLVSRELDRLGRRAGFKRRMDDHVTKYVESRLDG